MGADESRIVTEVVKNDENPYTGRLMIGTPTLGDITMEWHNHRIGQIIPVNWGMVDVKEMLSGYVPLGFLVSDAQNLIVKRFMDTTCEWLLLYEDDVLPPMDAFIKLNHYMLAGDVPVVSGLYTAKTRPAEWLLFRGRGNGFYNKWKLGDKVWVDGVPTGFLLINGSILRAMWDDCEEYTVKGIPVRRMFRFPRDMWFDPEKGQYRTLMGTSDLDWCTRVMEGGYLKQAGFPAIQRKKYPFLCDTSIKCGHIDRATHEVYP